MEAFIHQIRRYRWLILLMLSGFVAPVLTNLVSSWLEHTFGQTPAQLIQLLALGVGASVALGALYLALREKPPIRVLVPREWEPKPCAGLVLLVGPGRPGEDPVEKGPNKPAIEHHLASAASGAPSLRVCWLITGNEGLPVALALRERYQSRCQVLIQHIHQPFDVQDTYRAVRDIYLNQAPAHDLPPDQVMADFTGGTRMMTAGMVLACGNQWPMQYMTGRKGQEDETASRPIEVRFEPEQGQ